MSVPFPSLAFFEALKKRVEEDRAVFEKLGTCDTSFGVRIRGGEPSLFGVRFEVYDCVEVRALRGSDEMALDFTLDAELPVWRAMLADIRANGGAGASQTLNTLSHLGESMRVTYDDPEGHDTFYRFIASVQAFFDQSAHVDVDLQAERRQR